MVIQPISQQFIKQEWLLATQLLIGYPKLCPSPPGEGAG